MNFRALDSNRTAFPFRNEHLLRGAFYTHMLSGSPEQVTQASAYTSPHLQSSNHRTPSPNPFPCTNTTDRLPLPFTPNAPRPTPTASRHHLPIKIPRIPPRPTRVSLPPRLRRLIRLIRPLRRPRIQHRIRALPRLQRRTRRLRRRMHRHSPTLALPKWLLPPMIAFPLLEILRRYAVLLRGHVPLRRLGIHLLRRWGCMPVVGRED